MYYNKRKSTKSVHMRRKFSACFLYITLIMMMSCQPKIQRDHTFQEIETVFRNGQFTLAMHWGESLLKSEKTDTVTRGQLTSLMDMIGRIRADFTLPESEIETRLNKLFGNYAQENRKIWEANNWLEFRIIDGEKRYFKRAVPNLKLILDHRRLKEIGSSNPQKDPFSEFRIAHLRKIIAASNLDGKPVVPVKMKVTYRLTVKTDAVPEGEMIRCWMPWPREIHERQGDVKLIQTYPTENFIAPDSVEQRSVYLEQKSSGKKPTIFEIQFLYRSSAQSFDLSKIKIDPYDTTSTLFKKYTSEQFPQIVFTNEIKRLSDSIVSGTTHPAEKVRKLYYWINDHIIWTGALEYSIIPFIPGYVLKNQRGDCGMQTLLFMSLARYQGIPVKWQSGWMMHPGEVNLHDWCEVFYQGIGWVPLDMSFNLQGSDVLREKEFYISGIDSYRLIINDTIGSQFVPKKKFPRSEPYDFQRGEVEWRGGNLYFNQWNYQMTVQYD